MKYRIKQNREHWFQIQCNLEALDVVMGHERWFSVDRMGILLSRLGTRDGGRITVTTQFNYATTTPKWLIFTALKRQENF